MGIALIFIILLVLVFLGVPVAFAIGLSALTNLMLKGELPLTIMVQRMVNGLDSFPFLAIPLFILAGQLLNKAGITDRIFDFALSIVGHIKGSLGHVNVVASIIFAGISGVAQADAAGLGAIEIEAMKKAGYRMPYAAAVTATSSIIGPIIPPSVIMAVFSVISSISLARLFLAGFIPGLIMGGCLMFMIYLLAATGRETGTIYKRQPLREVGRRFVRAIPALLTPVILVAGMLLGAATPTELGALCVVYGLVLAVCYGNMNRRMLVEVFEETLIMVGILVFVISAAFPFSWIVAVNDLPTKLTNLILAFSTSQWLILLIVNIVLLILGSFMETTAILLIMVPVLFPLAMDIGLHPVHFGLIVIINLLIGAVTPPFGMCLYIVAEITKVPFMKVVKATIPFLIPLLITLLLVTYIPELALFIPNLVFK
ncbi:TRAP transporter large permease subunit [candidate division KSB3 bacterium]|uniref:TRAP transporter large permease subunit n=1 Tax=candidate division KSB3 bacterium TaxID=2044937 RepID=A0A9D5JS93_9BACT|nr:TRAP transporter large permease subunit [candidate division KSB3 bacterium]MBD3323300.1 TRAP transporter large permease subunit [candidate division KSB3 bacterium]